MKAADTILGFDFGARRIGVAIGSRRLGHARALTTLHCQDGPDWSGIEELVREWEPEALIVGVPVTMEGGQQAVTAAAREFMRQLIKRFDLPVHGAEERMSTIEAESDMREQRRSGRRRRRVTDDDVDMTAARVILEHWIHEHPAAQP